MAFRHIQILVSILLICIVAAPASAELFGTYAGLEQQISDSSDIIVLQILPPPHYKTGCIFESARNRVGVINLELVKILGSIKGNQFQAGTTRTIGLGSFGALTKNPSPAVVRETCSEPGDAVYLVFMDHEKTINQELNMLHVIKGPYERQTDETTAQAITRLTGLEK